MKTLPEMFEALAKQNAKRTALVDEDKRISYAVLVKEIVSLATRLQGMGVRRGDPVALMLPNGTDFVRNYFAIVTLGAIAVPLNDHYQQQELLYFLDVCEVSALITSQDYTQLCRQVLSMRRSPCELLLVEDWAEASETSTTSIGDFSAEIDPNSPVMYQFSSGSTGRPKRIARTHANLLFELESFIRTLGITKQDRFLGVAPFSHVNGLMRSMLASMRAGAALYPLAKFERRAITDIIEKNKVSVFIAVPFMFSMLAKANFRREPDFSSLRLCVSASAPMPVKLNQQFYQKFGIYVRQLYGSTETGTISVNLSSDVERSLASVGTPIGGVEVEVFSEDGRIAAVDEMGEFAIKSPGAIKGYYGLDDLNKEVFREGYFFSGDLGEKRQGWTSLSDWKKEILHQQRRLQN